LITRERYREALNDCLENLSNFSFDKEIELSAEDIRLAARALGKITGQIEVDEILDKIFGSFCIGK
ncbi:MAG TPA: tRNA uridine-5-carboxymethylaminomethyl(34) synthesis GTPase MnmE, partial [Alphaproteobacteria bacterium]|nr:tRNA uridine-5-carboxymethylaminomethyl(34) synthesis GTPase MnmE [Alphaproteobacteria bacterium]